ncbi:MAG: nucleoside triphosphate pyrophosphohydrolase [Aquificae bacterium]|nr:nucleoside triphosphate pyrophosphohydrolase [Aquificota bacterium]
MTEKKKYTFRDLLEVMRELREKCPWDREQTHESLKKYLIEETYEVIDAIDEKDDEKLKEELGDLLLQVVFHSQIASERGAFTIEDVIDALVKKLIERHPHVFGNEKPEDVLKNWERKKMEKRKSVLEGIPKHLPALMRSQKLQDRVSQVGFDFGSIEEVLEKLREEIEEFRKAYEKGDREEVKHEIGDLLTAVVELARFSGVDAEEALHEANERFIRRFSYIEEKARKEGKDLRDMSLEEMNFLWEEAKKREKE